MTNDEWQAATGGRQTRPRLATFLSLFLTVFAESYAIVRAFTKALAIAMINKCKKYAHFPMEMFVSFATSFAYCKSFHPKLNELP